MILRLVYSFLFLSLVSGNQRLEDNKKTASPGPCDNTVCACQDGLASNPGLHSPPSHPTEFQGSPTLRPPLRVEEGHYGFPPKGLISPGSGYISGPTRVETKSFDVEYVSDDNHQYQPPRPQVQYIEEETTQYKEKTICFTPRMVHRMVKAALEYVSQIPSDINSIIDKIDQELNRMSDQDSIEEHYPKKPLYPLDSRTIFQLLNKPKAAESRTNLILKYELPSVQEPQCKEALEKLIEIAYNAYLELEQHPQCRDYLYRFASHQPEDRPKGHLDYGPDLKSLLASILEQIDKYKPKSPPEYNHPDYYNPGPEMDIPMPEIPIPQIHEINIPKHDTYELHSKMQDAYELNMPKIHEHYEMNIPKIHDNYELNIPKIHDNYELNIPKIHDNYELNIPNIHDTYELNIPKIHDTYELNIPKIHENYEINIPKIHDNYELNIPQIHETTYELNMPQLHEIKIPQIHEYNIPHIPEMPQIHEFDIPQIHETIHETIQENIPMQPEETINILIKLLKNNDVSDQVFDRLLNVVEENPNHFQPNIFKIILALLNARKGTNIPRFNDIFLLLLDSQRHAPWNEKMTEHILSFLVPDETGNVDSRLVDIILQLYKNPTNEKHVEYVLSLLRPIKEGHFDDRYGDIILNIIKLHQNNMLHPDYVDILLKLLNPSSSEPMNDKEADVVNHLSRWNEMGLSPNQLDVFFKLLKPDMNGNTDKKSIDIVHFLLTQNTHELGLQPTHIEFLLSFLYPEDGILDARRIDIIHFLLTNMLLHPKHMHILISLLEENAPGVLNSRFLEILMFLHSNRLLNPELLDTIIGLLNDEITGNLDDNQVKTFFFQLAPYKQSHPKLVVDILTLLNQGGLHGNIVEWLESSNNNAGIPNRDSVMQPPPNVQVPSNLQVLIEKVENLKGRLIDSHDHDYRTPDGGLETENDFMAIFKWLDSQGLLNPAEQGAPNNELVDKLLKILEMGERELGVVELTYMLKHEKPLVYQPVYYVKYRLPIMSFISNMKSLLVENPQLTSDPMKLLQELIVISNVTEVSPNLQGFPKEEILKLTFNDGDLVQAKILDEQNLSLNEQITYVHGLNADISPEEILELNRMNEAKYFPSMLQIKSSYPEKVTVHEVDKIVEFPPIHYRFQRKQGFPIQAHTLQKVFDRSHYTQQPHKNAQLRSPK